MAVNVDNHSPRLDLPLPNEQNFLQDDVKRLVDCLSYLDSYVATVANDGKLDPTQLPDNAAKVDATGIILPAQLPTNVVVLDAKGKIPVKNLPPAGTTNIFEVSSETAMLALAATPGDICKRLDVGESYVLADTDSTKANSWRALPVNIVKTINGQAGDVSNVAILKDVGGALTIENLTGPLRLKAKASDAYDAVTLGELRTIQAISSGGASMSGVMNFGVGKPLMHPTRAYIPPYELPLDGQIVNRVDWPELWAWAQLTSPASDADWQTDIALRGGYSTGDGSTTFRLPDWNGVQKNGVDGITGPDSVPNLYFRGTGESAKDMGVMRSAAPNITGTLSTAGSGAFQTAINPGSALNPYGAPYPSSITPKTGEQSASSIQINANNSNKVYGRYSTDTIQTDVVNGVWVVRASGGFIAADTSWNVINADAVAPAQDTSIEGGKVISRYDIGGTPHVSASFSVKARYLNDGWADISLRNEDINSVDANVQIHSQSLVRAINKANPAANTDSFGGAYESWLDSSARTTRYLQRWASGGLSTFFVMDKPNDSSYKQRVMELSESNDLILAQNPFVTGNARGGAFVSRSGDRFMNICAYDTVGVDGGTVLETGFSGGASQFYFFASGGSTGRIKSGTLNALVAMEGSDRTLKTNITPSKPGALDRIMRIESVEFDWKINGQHERGWIAQQVQEIDPVYIYDQGDPDAKLNVNTRCIVSDLIGAVQTLKAEIEELKKKVA